MGADLRVASPPVVERRQDDFVSVGNAKAYLWGALGLTVFMVLMSFAVLVLNPKLLEQPEVRYVGAFLGAVIVALFAGAGINVVNVLNGHSALITRVVGQQKFAEGKLVGLQENPKTNID